MEIVRDLQLLWHSVRTECPQCCPGCQFTDLPFTVCLFDPPVLPQSVHQSVHDPSPRVSMVTPPVSLKSVHSASPECPPECPWCSLRVSPDRWFHLLQHNACRQKSPCWVCAVCCVPLCTTQGDTQCVGPPAGWVSLTLWCGFSDRVGDVFTFLS